MSHQQSLFETEPPPWEVDDAAEQLVATVVLAGGPAGEFDYLVPAGLIDRSAGAAARSRAGVCACRWGAAIAASSAIALHVANKPTGGRQAQVGGRRARSPAASVARHAAADAVDGRLLSVSLGPGAGGRGAGRRAASRPARAM